MVREKYYAFWLSVFLGLMISGCAGGLMELDMADKALQSARDSQAPSYAAQEYKDAEKTINLSHEQLNKIGNKKEALALAIAGMNKAKYAQMLSLQNQEQEQRDRLLAQITATKAEAEKDRALADSAKRDLRAYKSKPAQQ